MFSLLIFTFAFCLLSSYLPLPAPPQAWAYDLLHDYSGTSFFDGWDFYGSWDNLTLGDVWWLNRDDAFKQGLVYFTNEGNAVMKVDNTSTVPFNDKRASIRITSQALYDIGSLWVADFVHLPFGCSVWPAFWTKGPGLWPNGGEIDIIEGINLMDHNQIALHTLPGCTQAPNVNELGIPGASTDCSIPTGCVVSETKPASFGSTFAQNGGGVFAAQFDVAGIFIWFFPRNAIPASLLGSTSTSALDISDWGLPSASYPVSTCNIPQFFTSQNLVLDITLCGTWAAIPEQYLPQCAGRGPTGVCYTDNVVGPGAHYSDAYFEISYVRAYTTGGAVPTPTGVAPPVDKAQAASFASELAPTGVWTSPQGQGGVDGSANMSPGVSGAASANAARQTAGGAAAASVSNGSSGKGSGMQLGLALILPLAMLLGVVVVWW